MAKKIDKATPREDAPTPEVATQEAVKQEKAPPKGRIVLEEKKAKLDNSEKEQDKKSQNKRVETAELHSAVRLGGQPQTNLHRVPGIKMLWVKGEGLLVQVPDGRTGKLKESIIPAASVKIATFE